MILLALNSSRTFYRHISCIPKIPKLLIRRNIGRRTNIAITELQEMPFLPLSNTNMSLQRAYLEELYNPKTILFGCHPKGSSWVLWFCKAFCTWFCNRAFQIFSSQPIKIINCNRANSLLYYRITKLVPLSSLYPSWIWLTHSNLHAVITKSLTACHWISQVGLSNFF